MFALVLLYDLSAVCISGIKFSSEYKYLNYIIEAEFFFLIFVRSAYGFTAVFLLWFILPDLKKLLDYWKSDWCSKRYEYLGGKVLEVLKYIIDCTFYPLFLDFFSEKDKEHPALMCFVVFLFILNAILAFDHRSNLPGVPHILVFVFGSTVLSVLNSAALATEVFLKAEKGKRIVEDLRVFVLPLESFFLICWLVLQTYAYCMQDKMRKQLRLIVQSCKTKGQSQTSSLQNRKPEKAVKMLLQQTLEMNRFSETDMHELILNVLDIIGFPESADRPADMQEMPQDAEEMVLLSPPEQSTAHTQEGSDDGHSEV
ncbi:uncharacterized protein LOC118213379 [Anguilla anguilla]|uniref:uncharacterized protein LOC118213379 n=1 Tax=Anguilla anguilla TaxID=7936 RepID=UPI0015B13C91|nr:uncharacterized protein LOC118213379 [Anguilla anguilla]